MKKLVGLVAVLIFLSLTVNAQETKKRVQKKAKLTSEQMATLQAKKMALHLELDANQQKAVYNLLKETADDRQKMSAELKQKKQDSVKLTDDEKFQLQSNRLDKQIAHKAAMKKILTKEQYEKWTKMSKAQNHKRQQTMRKKKAAAAARKAHQKRESKPENRYRRRN